MATTDDLIGSGVPPLVSQLLGLDPAAATAAGSTQSDATAVYSELITLTATGADGIKLPLGMPVGQLYFVSNQSGSTGKVYVGLGDTLNGTLNGSVSLATAKTVLLIQYKANFWGSILTA